MEEQLPKNLLKKYLNGECTPQEELVVKEWYNSFVNDDDHISSMNSLQKADLRARLKKAIDDNITLLEKTQPVAVKKHFGWRYLGYAVTGIAALLLIGFGMGVFSNNDTEQIQGAAIPELVNVKNNTSSIQEQVLSDGSHVWLYPGAQLKFNKKFTGNTREVTLSGESFFDVAKNPDRPFIIYSENMVTKVWGTSFRVRDVAGARFADVAVVTGKVSVKTVQTSNAGIKEVMLHPNEQVTYLKNKQSLKAKITGNDQDLAIWKKVNLSFDNQPLKEVIPVLNKYFGVAIVTNDDELNNYLLNADFNGLNFVSIMEILNKTLNISYEINNTNILLKNNN